ncbi:unnamed protein product [Dibothriocephalus latus]|uniref:Uncharacterized protein n=1 Tax=Dibothriocephalus latus TaxID=60516 RepID=A0A3P7N3D6_DIBLA|nr:unnamed protein product [Dibothriocephalus latus]
MILTHLPRQYLFIAAGATLPSSSSSFSSLSFYPYSLLLLIIIILIGITIIIGCNDTSNATTYDLPTTAFSQQRRRQQGHDHYRKHK